MHEPNTICVCSVTKGALVNDFPCLHRGKAATRRRGRKIGRAKGEPARYIRDSEPRSISTLKLPSAGWVWDALLSFHPSATHTSKLVSHHALVCSSGITNSFFHLKAEQVELGGLIISEHHLTDLKSPLEELLNCDLFRIKFSTPG